MSRILLTMLRCNKLRVFLPKKTTNNTYNNATIFPSAIAFQRELEATALSKL